MISDKVKKMIYQIQNCPFFNCCDNEQKKKIVKGLKDKIQYNLLFEIKDFDSDDESSNSFENNYGNYFNDHKNSTKASSNFIDFEENETNLDIYEGNYTLEEINIIEDIYKKIIEVRYCAGDVEYQRKYIYNELIKFLLGNK